MHAFFMSGHKWMMCIECALERLTNQPINQPTDQQTNQPTSQSINQSINQSMKSINRSINQRTNQNKQTHCQFIRRSNGISYAYIICVYIIEDESYCIYVPQAHMDTAWRNLIKRHYFKKNWCTCIEHNILGTCFQSIYSIYVMKQNIGNYEKHVHVQLTTKGWPFQLSSIHVKRL